MRILSMAFVLALTGAAAPGPLLALVIGQVLAQGLPAAAYILAGHALLEAGFIFALTKGLSQVLARPRTRGVLAAVGGAVLLWMGLELVRTAPSASMRAAAGAARGWWTLMLAGAGVSISNPYFTGWWATVGTGQVATFGIRTKTQMLAFFLGHELGDVAWYMFVAVLLVLGRTWLTDGAYRALLLVCGIAIVLLAGVFLIAGLRCLRARARTAEADALDAKDSG